jgi:acyl-CoA synthetase (AMP-forming)/AMP-acid ligase II
MFLLTNPDPGRTALIDTASETRLSYRELESLVRAAGADLATDRKRLIFVVGSRQIASVVAYIAAIEAGHAVAWIDPALPDRSFDRLLTKYEPELVVPGSRRAVQRAAHEDYSEARHSTLGRFWNALRPAAAPPIHPDLACLLATSGSTGSTRLVRLSRWSLAANANAIVRALGLSADDVAITSLPIAHAFGLSVLDSHLVAGSTVVLDESSILQAEFWRVTRDERVTSLAGVPLTFELLRRLELARILPATVTSMIQAGGRLHPDHVAFLRDFMAARGGTFRVMYGQTEATARISVWPEITPPDKIASVGRVIPGGEIRIDAATSEILYRGPNVMMGYAESRADLALPGDLRELSTGDLGYLDEDGFLFLTGRTKRIAKLAGCRVNLDDVEAMLEGMSAAAVEIDGRLTVFVEAPRGGDLDAVAQRLSETLGLDPALVRATSIVTLPRSSAGKVLYAALAHGVDPAVEIER